MKQLTEEDVIRIVNQQIYQNSNSGAPNVPPHNHDGTNNLAITVGDLDGYNSVPGLEVGKVALINNLPFFGSLFSYPLPVISGDLGASDVPFPGGEAPDGTMIIYKRATAWQLWIMLFSTWHGVDLPLTV